jgi:hypothetical protein
VLEKVLLSLGTSYYAGTACHLDLVQWATDPTWADLRAEHKKSLIDADLPFLRQQLSLGNIRLLLLNGSGIARAVREILDCDLVEKVIPGSVPLKLFVGHTSECVKVIGWNKNLQSSFGVSNEYIRAVAVATGNTRLEPE